MKYLHNFLVAMVCMATVTFVQAEVQAWRERVVAAVRPGAVVARRGLDTDPITLAVLFGQGGGRWSHVGIAVQLVLDGPIYIESAMPGAGTKLEKPEAFFSTEQASDGEVVLMPMTRLMRFRMLPNRCWVVHLMTNWRSTMTAKSFIARSWWPWHLNPLM
jgi:hypothetical protein